MHPGISTLYPGLQAWIRQLPDPSFVPGIPEPVLGLSEWIAERLARGEVAPVIFICTHNSRRSVFAQCWMAALAAAYGLEGIRSFSGGTEETAVALPALRSLARAGFAVETASGENARHRVAFSDQQEPLSLFSKLYRDPANPSEGFAAVLLCDSADVGCPVVQGASARFFLPFTDPKMSDGTAAEDQTYDQTSLAVAAAMDLVLYLTHQRHVRTP